MIEFPCFWFKRPEKDTFYISNYPLPDFRPSPMHYRDGKLYSGIRISKYKINQNGSSMYGGTVWENITIPTYREKLHSKKLYMFDAACYYSLAILMFVKYANWDVQNLIALGYVLTTNNNTATPTVGFTDSILSMDGRTNENISNNAQHTLTFGIEDYYSNRMIYLDGIFRANTDRIVYSTSLSQPDFSAGLTDDLDPVWKIVETPIVVGGSGDNYHGYITELIFDNEFPELLLPAKGVFTSTANALTSICNKSSGAGKYGTGIVINKAYAQCFVSGGMHVGRGYMGGILSFNSNYSSTVGGSALNPVNKNLVALSFEMVK